VGSGFESLMAHKPQISGIGHSQRSLRVALYWSFSFRRPVRFRQAAPTMTAVPGITGSQRALP